MDDNSVLEEVIDGLAGYWSENPDGQPRLLSELASYRLDDGEQIEPFELYSTEEVLAAMRNAHPSYKFHSMHFNQKRRLGFIDADDRGTYFMFEGWRIPFFAVNINRIKRYGYGKTTPFERVEDILHITTKQITSLIQNNLLEWDKHGHIPGRSLSGLWLDILAGLDHDMWVRHGLDDTPPYLDISKEHAIKLASEHFLTWFWQVFEDKKKQSGLGNSAYCEINKGSGLVGSDPKNIRLYSAELGIKPVFQEGEFFPSYVYAAIKLRPDIDRRRNQSFALREYYRLPRRLYNTLVRYSLVTDKATVPENSFVRLLFNEIMKAAPWSEQGYNDSFAEAIEKGRVLGIKKTTLDPETVLSEISPRFTKGFVDLLPQLVEMVEEKYKIVFDLNKSYTLGEISKLTGISTTELHSRAAKKTMADLEDKSKILVPTEFRARDMRFYSSSVLMYLVRNIFRDDLALSGIPLCKQEYMDTLEKQHESGFFKSDTYALAFPFLNKQDVKRLIDSGLIGMTYYTKMDKKDLKNVLNELISRIDHQSLAETIKHNVLLQREGRKAEGRGKFIIEDLHVLNIVKKMQRNISDLLPKFAEESGISLEQAYTWGRIKEITGYSTAKLARGLEYGMLKPVGTKPIETYHGFSAALFSMTEPAKKNMSLDECADYLLIGRKDVEYLLDKKILVYAYEAKKEKSNAINRESINNTMRLFMHNLNTAKILESIGIKSYNSGYDEIYENARLSFFQRLDKYLSGFSDEELRQKVTKEETKLRLGMSDSGISRLIERGILDRVPDTRKGVPKAQGNTGYYSYSVELLDFLHPYFDTGMNTTEITGYLNISEQQLEDICRVGILKRHANLFEGIKKLNDDFLARYYREKYH